MQEFADPRIKSVISSGRRACKRWPVQNRVTGNRNERRGLRSFALGKTLVNAVPVSLVGDDENATIGACDGCKETTAAKKTGKTRNAGIICMCAGKGEGALRSSRREYGGFRGEIRRLWGGVLTMYPRLFHVDRMNGFLAICGICREIMG